MKMLRDDAHGVVRRVNTFAGEVVLLHGFARRYEAGTEAGAFSLKMVRSGCATWRSEGRTIRLREAMFAFVPPGAPYVISIRADTMVETACLFFSAEMLAAVGNSVSGDLEPSGRPPAEWHLHATAADAGTVSRLVDVVAATKVPPDDVIDDILAQDLPGLFRAHVDAAAVGHLLALRPGTRAELRRRVSEGRDYLVDHLVRPVRLRDAAAAAGLSPFHFHRTFTALFGIPPRRYVSERRLERAAYLLRQTSRPILDISLDCGFESLGSFGKAFARRFGTSPGRYRAGAK